MFCNTALISFLIRSTKRVVSVGGGLLAAVVAPLIAVWFVGAGDWCPAVGTVCSVLMVLDSLLGYNSWLGTLRSGDGRKGVDGDVRSRWSLLRGGDVNASWCGIVLPAFWFCKRLDARRFRIGWSLLWFCM